MLNENYWINTLWKGIEKIYNFSVKGLAKFSTQNQQNAINLLLLLNEQNWAGLQQQNGRRARGSLGENWFDQYLGEEQIPSYLLLASPLLSSTRWLLLLQRRGGAGSIHVKGPQLSSNPSEHPMVQNIWTIIDSSDLRIMRVICQMVAFLRDLRIRGLRSTIGATDQSSNFGRLWGLSRPNLNLIF
jgi:hypothetical protein